MFHEKSNHIEIDYHFVHEKLVADLMSILYAPNYRLQIYFPKLLIKDNSSFSKASWTLSIFMLQLEDNICQIS